MIRPTKDNVLLVLEPDVLKQTASGVIAVQLTDPSKAYGKRMGRVLAVGPGHFLPRRYRATGAQEADIIESAAFQPTSVLPGERVIIGPTAGDRYAYTKRQDFAEMYGDELDKYGIPRDSAEFRCVREDEIDCVIDDDSPEVREGSAAAE